MSMQQVMAQIILNNSTPLTNYLPSVKANFYTPVSNVKMLNV